MNEKYQEFYDYLKSENLTDLDAESFQTAYSEPEKYEELWGYVSQNNLTDLSKEDFFESYFGGVKKKEETVTASVSEPGSLVSPEREVPVAEAVVEEEVVQPVVADATRVEEPVLPIEQIEQPDLEEFVVYEDPGAEIVAEAEGEKNTWVEDFAGKNFVTDFIGDIYRAGAAGQAQGASVDESLELMTKGKDVTDEDIQDFLAAQERMASQGESDEMKEFNKIYEANGSGWLGFLKGTANNPTILPQLFVSSVSAMATPATLAAGAAGAGTGAAIGATGFSAGPLGVFTTVGGTLAGAMGAMGTTLETGLAFSEFLQEELEKKGLEMTTEGIRKVLEDPEAIKSMRYRAAGRGIAIGFFNSVTAGLGSQVVKSVAKATGRKVVAGLAGAGVEVVSESAGEVVGRLVAGQEMDVAEIGFEGFAGGVPQVVGLGRGLYKSPTYKINNETVSGPVVADFIKNAPVEDLTGATLEIKNDPVLKDIAVERRENARMDAIIKAELAKAGITDEGAVTALTKLEKERRGLEGNGTRAAQQRLAEVNKEIDGLMDGAKIAYTETVDASGDKVTTEVIVTKEYAKEELIKDGIESPTEQQVEAKQAELFEDAMEAVQKPQEDAIQEPSPETVDAPEPTRGSEAMGEGVPDIGEPTAEVEAEDQVAEAAPTAEVAVEEGAEVKITDGQVGDTFTSNIGEEKVVIKTKNQTVTQSTTETINPANQKQFGLKSVTDVYRKVYGDKMDGTEPVQKLNVYPEKSLATGFKVTEQEVAVEETVSEPTQEVTEEVAVEDDESGGSAEFREFNKGRRNLEEKGYTQQAVRDIISQAISSLDMGRAGDVRKLVNSFKKLNAGSLIPKAADLSSGDTVGMAIMDSSENLSNDVYRSLARGEVSLEELQAFAKKFNQPLPEPVAETVSEPTQEVTEEEQVDIDDFFSDKEIEGVDKVADNLVVNRKQLSEDKAETAQDERKISRIKQIAKKAAVSLKKQFPDVKIVLHETEGQYKRFAGKRARGAYVKDDKSKTIHINLSIADLSTVPHEVFHALLLEAAATDPQALVIARNMLESVRKVVDPNSEMSKVIEKFVAKYEDVPVIQDEEYLAELMGILSSQYRTLDKPSKNAIKEFLRKLAKLVGIDTKFGLDEFFGPEFLERDEQVIDLLNTISGKVSKGQFIEAADVQVMGDILSEATPTEQAQAQSDVRDFKRKQREKKAAKNIISDEAVTPRMQVVTEEDGKPVTFYHGTDKKFDKFEPQKSTRTILMSQYEVKTPAIFFTPDEAEAREYGDNIIPVNLQFEKLVEDNIDEAAKIITDYYVKEKDGVIEVQDGVVDLSDYYDEATDSYNNNWVKDVLDEAEGIDWMLLDEEALVEKFKEAGFDGTKVYEGDKAFSVATFYPENIVRLDQGMAPRQQVADIPQSAKNVLYGDSDVLPKPSKKKSNSQVAQDLAEVAAEYYGGEIITSKTITPEQEETITEVGTEEAIAAFEDSGKSAADWYSTAIEKAMAVAAVIHPSLSSKEEASKYEAFAKEKDPVAAANFVMRVALAITSQNLNVEANAKYANEQFDIFKKTGRFDASREYGTKAKSISSNLRLANVLVEKIGLNATEDFVLQEFNVSELEVAASKALGKNVKVSGLRNDKVNGAALFGPKIGQGFLQNLMGKFDPVTIDLWLRRTWGRWTGDVVGVGVKEERMARLLNGLKEAKKDTGVEVPDVMKKYRVVRKVRPSTGASYDTMSDQFISELEEDAGFRDRIAAFAKTLSTKGDLMYKLIKNEPMSDGLYKSFMSGEKTYGQTANQLQRIKDKLSAKYKDYVSKEKAKGRTPLKKSEWVKGQNQKDGRVNSPNNEAISARKPEWVKAATSITNDLKPIDIPTNQDRKVITRIVNDIKNRMTEQGYPVTNADVQALLWYPEKDIWAKLRGEEESNLKQSYDDQFIKIAEQKGLGKEAKSAAENVERERAAQPSGVDERKTDVGVSRLTDKEDVAPRQQKPYPSGPEEATEMGYLVHASDKYRDSFDKKFIKGRNRTELGALGFYFTANAQKAMDYGGEYTYIDPADMNLLNLDEVKGNKLQSFLSDLERNLGKLSSYRMRLIAAQDEVRSNREFNELDAELKKVDAQIKAQSPFGTSAFSQDKVLQALKEAKAKSLMEAYKVAEYAIERDGRKSNADAAFSDLLFNAGYDGIYEGPGLYKVAIFDIDGLNNAIVKPGVAPRQQVIEDVTAKELDTPLDRRQRVFRSGDLENKAEPRWKFRSSRETGHFGTGFYFFGTKEQADKYDARDVSELDIDKYNLAKATKELHQALRVINDRYNEYYTAEAVDELKKEPLRQAVPTFFIEEVAKAAGMGVISEAEAEAAATEVTKALTKDSNPAFGDSVSTLVMKALGFDGVNAVGTSLDNSKYGTVIYDLKGDITPRQQLEDIATPLPRQQKSVREVVQQARDNNFKDAATKDFLKRKGVPTADIDKAIKTLDDVYARVMKEIDGVITKSQKRGVDFDTQLKNALAYLQGTKLYENTTDIHREKLIREVRAKFDKKEKRAPSAKRILGNIKDVKKVTLSEKEALKMQLRLVAKTAKTTARALVVAGSELTKSLKEMVKGGVITANQMSSVLRRFSRVDLFNPASIDSFLDYMAKIFADAEYGAKIARIKKLLPRAKKNIKSKIGVADVLGDTLTNLFNVNPTLIPMEMLEDYIKLVEMMGAAKKVLPLADINDVTEMANKLLNSVYEEVSMAEDLAEVFANYENKVIKDGKLDYAATIEAMIADQTISLEEAAVMRKYKSRIVEPTKKEPKTEEELAEERAELMSAVEAAKVNVSRLVMDEERTLARQLAKLMRTEAIERLSNQQLETLLAVIDNINNGFVTHAAHRLAVTMNASNRAGSLLDPILKAVPLPVSTFVGKIKSGITKNNKFFESVKRNPLVYIDQVFGDFQTTRIYDAVFKPLAQAYDKFSLEMKRVDERLTNAQNAVMKSFKNDPNKARMSSYKMMAYMLQREFEANPDNKQVNPAADFIRATIDHINKGQSFFKGKDAEMLQQILDDFGGEQIDSQKLYDSFNKAERNALAVMEDINKSMGSKAVFTGAVIRGRRVDALNQYAHHNVLSTSGQMDRSADVALIEAYNQSMRASTKSKNLIERTGAVTPLNFDVFSSVSRGSRFTLTDFYLTEPIRTSRKAISDTRKVLEERGDVTKQENEIVNAVENALELTLDDLLTRTFSQSTMLENVIQYVKKTGYRLVLASGTRAMAEGASNLAFAAIYAPKDFAVGRANKTVLGAVGIDVMGNLKSTQISRMYPNEVLSGRMIDTSVLGEKAGDKGGRAYGDVRNKITQIYNGLLSPAKKGVEVVADTLISAPDKAVIRPLWFGSFENAFVEITGKKPDFEKIAANDEAYMAANQEALDKATDTADQLTTLAGAADNPFKSMLRGKYPSKAKQTALLQFFNNFNSFMTRFLIYEYISARTAVNAMLGNGMISKRQGAALLGAVTTRMVVYTLAGTILNQVLKQVLGLGDEEDEKDIMKQFGQALASTATSLIVGRDFGNVVKGLLNYGVENLNEEFLDELRDGDYDPYRDAIAYTFVPPDKEYKSNTLADYIRNLMGPFGPFYKMSEFGVKALSADEKKDPAARIRQQRELNERLPLELLGNLGLIPLYRDIRSLLLADIYKGMGKDKKGSSTGMTKAEKAQMKEYFPEMYEMQMQLEEDMKNPELERMMKEQEKAIEEMMKGLK